MKLKNITITPDFDDILKRINCSLNDFVTQQTRDTIILIGTIVVCILECIIFLMISKLLGPTRFTRAEAWDYAILLCMLTCAFVAFTFLPDSSNWGDLNGLEYSTIQDMLYYRSTHSEADPYGYLIAMPGAQEIIPNWELIRSARAGTVNAHLAFLSHKVLLECSADTYELSLIHYDFENVTRDESCKLSVSWDKIQLVLE